MVNLRDIDDLSYKKTVDKIIELNEHIRTFWSAPQGWAPIAAANLLSAARLDWLVSLSYSLNRWENDPNKEALYGDLILAWSNLGALVEGSMKFFLSVYYEDYKSDINKIIQRGKEIDPDMAMFNELRRFFEMSIWSQSERQDKNDWLAEIQGKRNAIHAYRDRQINDFGFFRNQVKKYFVFLIGLLERVPYPDVHFGPDLSIS